MVILCGDLHADDRKIGCHINYEEESWGIMVGLKNYLEQMRSELPDEEELYFIMTGDMSGALTDNKRFSTLSFRLKFNSWLMAINTICNFNVYSVKGNHDFTVNDISEFDYAVGMGLIKHVNELKIDQDKCIIKLFDYGSEFTQPSQESGVLNVAVTHENLGYKDIKMPYYAGDFVFIEDTPLKNYDIIFGGHIHTPTDIITKVFEDGKTANIVYLGCPTRPAYDKENMWEHVKLGLIQNGEYDTDIFNLLPSNHIFNPTAIQDTSKIRDFGIQDTSDLERLIENLAGYESDFYKDPREQILRYPGYSEKSRQLAMKYYNKVQDA